MSNADQESGSGEAAIRALLVALEDPGALHPEHVRHLISELTKLLPEAMTDSDTLGTAFNGRLIAIDGDAPPPRLATPPDP